MRLPNGVTGFFSSSDSHLTQMDERQFRQYCYSVVNYNDGKLNNLKESEYPMNFYHAHITFKNGDFHILLNKHYPLLAFASSVNNECIEFIDVPSQIELLFSTYEVLHTSILKQPVIFGNHSKQDFLQVDHALNRAELEAIKYWKPSIIGEIIFNYWD